MDSVNKYAENKQNRISQAQDIVDK